MNRIFSGAGTSQSTRGQNHHLCEQGGHGIPPSGILPVRFLAQLPQQCPGLFTEKIRKVNRSRKAGRHKVLKFVTAGSHARKSLPGSKDAVIQKHHSHNMKSGGAGRLQWSDLLEAGTGEDGGVTGPVTKWSPSIDLLQEFSRQQNDHLELRSAPVGQDASGRYLNDPLIKKKKRLRKPGDGSIADAHKNEVSIFVERNQCLCISKTGEWAYFCHVQSESLFLLLVDKHKSLHRINHYTSILTFQALARYAIVRNAPALIDRARAELMPFALGQVAAFGNFQTYHCGGNGAALLHRHGHLPEAEQILRECADAQMAAPRGMAGVYCRPKAEELPLQRIWIDTAFAVCPFLAHCGIAFHREDMLDDAVAQILGMRSMFLDPECGLVHQGMNFNGQGIISSDHWSRGNGWGLLALAEVVDSLPDSHPRREECRSILRDWLLACLACRNEENLWYQEMTVKEPGITYTETSGSALILFALSVAIRHGLLPEAMAQFHEGLAALMNYITPDGSIFHTCTSCCCPEDGSIAAYLKRPPIRNDSHAFGAVLMALVAAEELGIPPHIFGKQFQPK